MARKTTRSGAQPYSASTSSGPSSQPKLKNRRNENDEVYAYEHKLPKHHRTSAQTLSLTRDELKGAEPRRKRKQDDEQDSNDDMEERVRKLAMMIAGDEAGEVDSEESSVDSDEAWEESGSDEERWGDVFRDMDRGKGGKRKGKGKEVVKKPSKPFTVNLDDSEDDLEPSSSRRPTSNRGASRSSKEKTNMPSPSAMNLEAESELLDDEDIGDDALEDALSENEFDNLGGPSGGSSGEEGNDDEEDEQIPGGVGDENDESEEEEEDGLDDDDDDDLDDDEVPLSQDDEALEEGGEKSEPESEDDDAADDEPDLPSDLGDDADDDLDPDTLDGLDAFVDRLASTDKKSRIGEVESVPERRTKRVILPTISGPALDDNDLKLKSHGKVDLATLINSHPSLSSASALLETAPQSSKPASILRQGVVPAPLPTTVKERIDREAAYEKTKEEGAKWAGVMKRVKEAHHLSFPLQASDRGGVKSSGEMLSGYKPREGMESAVQALLDKANLTEKGVQEKEEDVLQAQELSVEELEERRARLRQQRELMFRSEARAKRVAKIKSKTFRKLARKRAARLGESDAVDELDAQASEEMREKMEMDRAKERATLKHGARTSRWAREGWQGEDKRMAKEEMLDIKQRLARRISGKGDGVSGDEDTESDEEGEDEDEDEEVLKARAFDQLGNVDKAEKGKGESGGGLMDMAFMKKAGERRHRQALEEEDELRRDIEMFGESDDSDAGEEKEDAAKASMMRVGGNEGRMVFSGPTVAQSSDETENAPAFTASRLSTIGNRLHSAPTSNAILQSLDATASSVNPWLVPSTSSRPSRKRNNVESSARPDKAVKSIKKALASDPTEDDGRVEISLDPSALLGESDEENGRDTEEREELKGIAKAAGTQVKRKRVAFAQRELVAEAFAGDNVIEDFAQEKARVIEEDAPKVEDTTLPGWGSWAGKGIKRRRPNPKFLMLKPGMEPSERKDANRSNVIISEKKDKKASKFLVKDLPYPYTSTGQYEKTFETPLGGEWNSRAGYQRGTLPRVMKKPGAIIEPVRRLF